MADFLTRLAQRTLGLAPVVQPRLISRFAPAAESMMASDYAVNAASRTFDAGNPTATTDVATNQSSTENQSSIEAMLPRRADQGAIATSNSFQNPQIPNSPNSSPTAAVTFFQRVNPQFSLPEQSSPLLVPEPAQKPPPEPQNSIVGQTEKLPNSLQQITEIQTKTEFLQTIPIQPIVSYRNNLSPAISESIQEVSSDFSSNTSPTNFQSTAEYKSPVKTEVSNLDKTYLPLINQENQQIESASLPPSIADLSPNIQPTSQPTIEIHIGRIEVRGIQNSPPKPPAKLTTKKPTLSLKDYLSQRNGGEL